jgi:hypothetical protein
MPTSSSCLKKPIDCEDLSVTCFILSTGAIVTKGRVYAYACESRQSRVFQRKKQNRPARISAGFIAENPAKIPVVNAMITAVRI